MSRENITQISQRLEDTLLLSHAHDRAEVVDEPADPSQLRWVSSEFVYFLDIPWIHNLRDRLLGGSQDEDRSSADISMRGLTFGLLENIMTTRVPTDRLLSRNRQNELVISGEELSRVVVPWARAHCANTSRITDTSHIEQGERVKRVLFKVISALDNAIYSTNGSLLDSGPDAEMACTLATFLVSLSRCARAIWGDDDAFDFLDARTRLYGEVTYLLRGKLAETWRERSAFELERLLGGGIPFAVYATSCPPTVNNVETVDTQTYVPQHLVPGCACEFVNPSIQDVRETLSQGQIPVVRFDGSNIFVRPSSAGPYVAISHVWVDGLGSVTESGLPRCQVARLSALAHELLPDADGGFWQDGLCIPREKVARKRAIALMAATYAEAAKVLVIDSGIRTQCTLATPREECLLRIATSGWMQRIWTLQEGMLARELLFELAHGALVDCTHFNGGPAPTAARLVPLFQYRCTSGAGSTFQKRLAHPPRCTVNDLIALLRYRTTSHPADEPVAVCGLLGVDAAEIVRLDGREDRMRALLVRVGELPRQLGVFGWFAQRLTLRHFSWAPASLSEVMWPGDADDARVATCTEEGLFAEYTVVRFPDVAIGVDCGVIATVVEERGNAAAGVEGEMARPRCARSGCASRVFNLVLSPYFFRIIPDDQRERLVFNGFLLKHPSLPDSMREEGVGVVRVLPPGGPGTSSSPSAAAPLRCHFVAAGSARWGIPDTVETTRSRGHWHFVNATIHRHVPVQLT